MRHSLAMKMQVWNDDTGECIEVSEDADGLGMLAIRWLADDGSKGPEIRLPAEHADKLQAAIKAVSTFMITNGD